MKKTEKKGPQRKRVAKKPAKNVFDELPMSKDDYKWMALGTVLIVIGYFLIGGGGTEDPTVFAGDTLFNFRRMYLAPIMILGGMSVVLWAIMKRSKEDTPSE